MSESLEELAKRFLRASLNVLKLMRNDRLIPTRTYLKGVEIKSETHTKVDIGNEPDIALWDDLYFQLEPLPEVHDLVSASQSHSNADSILVDAGGNPLDPRNHHWWVLGSYLMHFLSDYVGRDLDLRFDARRFAEVLPRLIESLEATEIRHLIVMPLLNLQCDLPLELRAHITFRELRPSEREEIWRFSERGTLGTGLVASPSACLAAEFVKPKAGNEPSHPSAYDIDHILPALRLLKAGDIASPCTLTYAASPPYSATGSSFSRTSFSRNAQETYRLAPADIPEVRRVTMALAERVATQSSKALSIRRFSEAYARESASDQLIDHWISLESLILPTEEAELSFRAPLRVAYLLGGSPEERASIYRDLRESYSLRSWLVHGQNPGKKNKKLKLWTREKIAAVTSTTEQHLRGVLKLTLLHPTEPRIPELDDAIVTGTTYVPEEPADAPAE